MKKIKLFIIPLMAMLPLASCGGGGDKPKTYRVTVGEECDHLSFSTKDGKKLDGIKVTAKKNFEFRMKVEEGSYPFIVPETLKIRISERAITDYEITVGESRTEANVTISGDQIVGDIFISGEADIDNGYRYKAPYLYGVTVDSPSGIHMKDEEGLKIQFAGEDDYSLPAAENIYVELDNFEGQKVWFSPAEGFDSICTYDDTTGELTIEPGADEYIKSNVVIVARASDYNLLLEDATWEQINEMSTAGIAQDIFNIGEEKTIEINGYNHKVRIIDFNRDVDVEGNKIGITFEFENVFGTEQIKWGNDNTNFIDSSLNKKLNGDSDDTVLSKLKAKEVGNYIKQTIKRVNVKENDKWINKSYATYLFPLTYMEMGKDDKAGDRYAYYSDATGAEHAKRIKTSAINSNPADYWTRSPRLGGDGKAAMYFTTAGGVYHDSPTRNRYFAPAFCI